MLCRSKKEYEAAAKRIDQELVRIAETDSNGNMLADVKKRRAEEKLVIKAEIDKRGNVIAERDNLVLQQQPNILENLYLNPCGFQLVLQ